MRQIEPAPTAIDEGTDGVTQPEPILGRHKDGGVIPNFAQTRNIAEHKRATGECGLKNREAEGLVMSGQGIDTGARIPIEEGRRR